jgi:hypothetical protein
MRTDARTARLAWSSSLPPVARFMPLWYPRDRLRFKQARREDTTEQGKLF